MEPRIERLRPDPATPPAAAPRVGERGRRGAGFERELGRRAGGGGREAGAEEQAEGGAPDAARAGARPRDGEAGAGLDVVA